MLRQIALITLAGVVGAWAGAYWQARVDRPATVPAVAAPVAVSYAEAVARAAPAVVSIYASRLTREQDAPLPSRSHAFGWPGLERTQRPRWRREHSLGSGVMVDRNGYILTNDHVIDGASAIRIVRQDGSEAAARVVGRDPDTDLAVLQTGGANITVAELGSSRALRVGEVVLAIGNPFGVGQTVTMGILSARGRSHLGISNFENFLQTDAAINPGNSGGALINSQGEVIGINTAIFAQHSGAQGIGFAIPVELASRVMQQIVTDGRVIRGWLGITGQDVDADLAGLLDLTERRGVLVTDVVAAGPAAQAGVRSGDVILRLNGEPVRDASDILQRIADAAPGVSVRLGVLRDGLQLTLPAVIEERPPPGD